MSDYRGHKVRVNLNGEEFDALRAEAGRTGNGMATLLRERFLQSLAGPEVSAPATFTFTRESLATALTRLEIKISLYSPETLKVDAESMADAIIEALGRAAG